MYRHKNHRLAKAAIPAIVVGMFSGAALAGDHPIQTHLTFDTLGRLLETKSTADDIPVDLSVKESLGLTLFTDTNLSVTRIESCSTCHGLKATKITTNNRKDGGHTSFNDGLVTGFADPISAATMFPVAPAATLLPLGSLNAPAAGYTAFTPIFHFDEKTLEASGGQFWNGRANDLEEQAGGPLLNPVEMAMPSKYSVIQRLRENTQHQLDFGINYVAAFEQEYKIDLTKIGKHDTQAIATAYDTLTQAIASFERSRKLNRFDSKFDFVTDPKHKVEFTYEEQLGYDLFTGKANCSSCHSVTPIDGPGSPVLFSDYGYYNLGVPAHPLIPIKDVDGLASNEYVETTLKKNNSSKNAKIKLSKLRGKQRNVSLRNIAVTPPYFHNGSFASLEDVVHFLNTRDEKSKCWYGTPDWGHARWCWAKPEVDSNKSKAVGSLGLNDYEENALIQFMKTLTDGYQYWGNDKNLSVKDVTAASQYKVPAVQPANSKGGL